MFAPSLQAAITPPDEKELPGSAFLDRNFSRNLGKSCPYNSKHPGRLASSSDILHSSSSSCPSKGLSSFCARQPQLLTTQHNFGPSFCATRTMPCHRTLLPSGSNWKYWGREVGCGLWCRVERYLPGKQREPCRTDCGSTTRRHTGDTKLDRSFEHSVIPFILLRICSVCSC